MSSMKIHLNLNAGREKCGEESEELRSQPKDHQERLIYIIVRLWGSEKTPELSNSSWQRCQQLPQK